MLWCVFFFKQKTAYEMRISDWSSDVCSSDLRRVAGRQGARDAAQHVDRGIAVALRDGAVEHDMAVDDAAHRVGDRLVMIVAFDQNREQEIGRASCRERVCQYV